MQLEGDRTGDGVGATSRLEPDEYAQVLFALKALAMRGAQEQRRAGKNARREAHPTFHFNTTPLRPKDRQPRRRWQPAEGPEREKRCAEFR